MHGLLRKAAFPSVHTRWQWSLSIEVYNAVQGISPSYIQTLFKEIDVPYTLRNKTIPLQPKCTTTKHGLNPITYQGARLWNTLPHHIQNAKNVSVINTYVFSPAWGSSVLALRVKHHGSNLEIPTMVGTLKKIKTSRCPEIALLCIKHAFYNF